jgi:glycerol-3-phosphate cytidylyltransferase
VRKQWTYVGGTFDLFHAGHVAFLARVAEEANLPVVVALNDDAFAERYKRRPIMNLQERFAVVRACRHVDDVVVNHGGEDSWDTITSLVDRGYKIRFVAHGDDWTGEGLKRQMGITEGGMAAYGIELLYVPYTKGISTGDIIDRVRSCR